jgi:hypothetical protein
MYSSVIDIDLTGNSFSNHFQKSVFIFLFCF